MIEEQYVSFETAKLAKEKGFDERCNYVYDKNKTLQMIRNQSYEEFDKRDKYSILCPTQSLLARWLREEYDLSVEVGSTPYGYTWCVCKAHNGTYIISDEDYDEYIPDNYEASKEIALQKALELIKRGSIKKWKYRN